MCIAASIAAFGITNSRSCTRWFPTALSSGRNSLQSQICQAQVRTSSCSGTHHSASLFLGARHSEVIRDYDVEYRSGTPNGLWPQYAGRAQNYHTSGIRATENRIYFEASRFSDERPAAQLLPQHRAAWTQRNTRHRLYPSEMIAHALYTLDVLSGNNNGLPLPFAVIKPHRSTTPLLTVTFNEPVGDHGCRWS